MTLTEKERRLIKQIEKHERHWKYTKWILAIGAILVIIAYMCVVILCYRTIRAEGKAIDVVSLLTFILPQAAFAFTVSFAALFIVIRDWFGSITRNLILKLIKNIREGSICEDQP